MSAIVVQDIATRFGLNFWVIQSWIENMNLNNMFQAEAFFEDNKDMIQAKPFVKWVGGKRQLIEQFSELFPKPTEYNDYFEPFLGGGAVYFNLQKEKSYLSDMNVELINTYQVIKDYPNQLIKFLKSIEHSKEKYTEIRAWDRDKDWIQNYSKIERAGRFIYLNRTCFN